MYAAGAGFTVEARGGGCDGARLGRTLRQAGDLRLLALPVGAEPSERYCMATGGLPLATFNRSTAAAFFEALRVAGAADARPPLEGPGQVTDLAASGAGGRAGRRGRRHRGAGPGQQPLSPAPTAGPWCGSRDSPLAPSVRLLREVGAGRLAGPACARASLGERRHRWGRDPRPFLDLLALVGGGDGPAGGRWRGHGASPDAARGGGESGAASGGPGRLNTSVIPISTVSAVAALTPRRSSSRTPTSSQPCAPYRLRMPSRPSTAVPSASVSRQPTPSRHVAWAVWYSQRPGPPAPLRARRLWHLGDSAPRPRAPPRRRAWAGGGRRGGQRANSRTTRSPSRRHTKRSPRRTASSPKSP